MKNNVTLYVISHTHWDREWYESFQNYRFRLVRMMDDLIELLENCEEYKYFHLDGQTIVLEDYLEIRPQNEQRLRKLIKDGRILIGPWYVMPDEFLVSGESLVRNLQKGIDICKNYETQFMRNGYVTDIFGHNAQFPQILKGFDIDSATMFRGIGDYTKDVFSWEGADGTKVNALKLDADRCYSNFYFSLRWPFEGKEINNDELLIRAKEMIERSRMASVCNAYLMMDGVDHIDAEPQLPEIIKLLNDSIEGITVKHATMTEYLEALKTLNPQLETLSGPLYNLGSKGLSNRVLKNVLSSMVQLKQLNDECETILTGWAEPFNLASSLFIYEYKNGINISHAEPRADFINTAWRYLLKNHPHDSICGCSITDVHKDNEYRFRQALQISDRITLDALECISENINTSSICGDICYTVFNPSQQAVDGYVALSFDFPLDTSRNFKLFDIQGNEIPYQLLDVEDVRYNRIAPIRKLISFIPYETCHIAANLNIPANGYTLVGVKVLKDSELAVGEYKLKCEYDRTRYLGTMRIARNRWDNGNLILEIAHNGTLIITNKESGKIYKNILAFEDCADVGDGWNYIKPIIDSEYLTIGNNCDVSIKSDGPFAVIIELTQRLLLPVSTNSDNKKRAEEHSELKIASTITLVKGSKNLNIQTKVNNNIKNHRLRVLFPTGLKTDSFYTQTPFDMQKWQLKREDWSKYKEADTLVNPTQGVTFLSDGIDSVEVYGKGLYEVEVSEFDATIALTLFRAFPNEVGQRTANMAQLQREMTFEYSIGFGVKRNPAKALQAAYSWKMGLKTISTDIHEGSLPVSLSFISVDCESSVVSAQSHNYTLSNGKKVEFIRLYNPSSTTDNIAVSFCKTIKEAFVIDFLGNIKGLLKIENNQLSLTAKPHEIITIAFTL